LGGSNSLLLYGIIGIVAVGVVIGIIAETRRKKVPPSATPTDTVAKSSSDSISAKLTPIHASTDSDLHPTTASPSSVQNVISRANEVIAEKSTLLGRFDGFKKLIAQLDADFDHGVIPQEEYLQRKDMLGQEMGKLIAEMDAKGIPYEF